MRSPARAVPRRALTLGLCTAVVAVAFEAIAVATAMPAAASALDGLSLYAWAFSLFLVGMLLSTVAGGRAADKVGPTRPLLFGMVLFAAGLLIAGTATGMPQLVAGRLVQGLGSGAMSVATYVLIAAAYQPAERPRMFSYISTAWVVPSFVGPPVAAYLTDRLGWPSVFFAVVPVLAVAAAMLAPALLRLSPAVPAATRQAVRRPAALWAAVLAASGAVAIQLAGQRLDIGSVALAVAGIALLGAGLPNLMPTRFFRLSRGLPSVIVVRGLIAGSFFGAEAFVPLMLVEQRGMSLLVAGGVLTVGAVGWTAGSWVQARPGWRIRRDRIITLGSLSLVAGLALATLAAALPQLWVGTVAVAWVLGGFGMGLSVSSTSLAVMSVSDLAEQGRNASSLQIGEALGASLFVGLAGTIFQGLQPAADTGFPGVIAAMTSVAAASLAVSLRVGRIDNELAPTA